jgi:MFS family permease
VIAAIAAIVLAVATNFPVFVLGNLLMGFGIGLYWPSGEALIADLTTPAQRNEAFALTRLCDNLGLGVGVVLGGLLIGIFERGVEVGRIAITAETAYRSLFVIDAVSYFALFGVVYWLIQETNQTPNTQAPLAGWRQALSDRALLTYVLVNILFTTYIWQITSTMPLYFTNFLTIGETGKGFSPVTISGLFTWHLALAGILQLPIARWLNQMRRAQALMLSALLWGLGFVVIWATGKATSQPLLWAGLALAVLALATVTYLPSASSVVVDLAPADLRGVYLAINSQCWAIGQFIGPPLGGWALDQSKAAADGFWLGLAASISLAIAILQRLDQQLQRRAGMLE